MRKVINFIRMDNKEKNKTSDYWFPAKRYGWGWGVPCSWQGWIVFIVYVLSAGVVTFLFPPEVHPLFFSFSVIVLSALLVLICWWKGEPPRWRWGD